MRPNRKRLIISLILLAVVALVLGLVGKNNWPGNPETPGYPHKFILIAFALGP